ncbi:MAG: tRNA pseudouridine(55) synthase TruB [Armatimonadota bacterium]
MPDGLLNVLKPPGMTSHDVVDAVRDLLGTRRVGHTGTLDPAATGVMVLMVGTATRLSEYLTARPKVYRAEITFGIATDTLDGEGMVVQRADASGLEAAAVRDACAQLVGEVEIEPPMHSAVHHRGRRLYALAREGGRADVPARRSVVERFDLLDFVPGALARAVVEVACSSGTYVRSLAVMVGELLGRPAYLSFLVRTCVGNQHLSEALTGAELRELVAAGRLEAVLIRPEDALPDWPRVVAQGLNAVHLSHGVPVPAWQDSAVGQHLLVMLADGRLLCVAEALREGGTLMVQPRRVLLSEDEL